MVGQPRFINPVYAISNDIDRDITNLVYSGLMKYDIEGKIVPDLIQDYQIKEGGKVYEIYLRKDVLFHDGEKLTADDVIFTIKTIQNPDFKSPLRTKWLGVEVKKIADYHLEIILKNPYPAFLETLTLKILPAHIWQNVLSQNFPLSPLNLQPIGSGPFRFQGAKIDPSGRIIWLTLKRWQNYYDKKPYLDKIIFYFFDKEEELVRAAKSGKINAFSPYLPQNYHLEGFNQYSFTIPRYFAIFLNPKENKILEKKEAREALNYLTDKTALIESVLSKKGKVVLSPLLPEIYQFEKPSVSYPFDPKKGEELFSRINIKKIDGWFSEVQEAKKLQFSKNLSYGSRGKEVENLQKCLAKFPDIYPEGEITGYFGKKTKEAVIKFQEKYKEEILAPYGLTKGTGKVKRATRKKLNEVCIVSPEKITPIKIILTTVKDPILEKTVQIIKKQWESQGVKTEIETFSISAIREEIIKERKYQALLFGQILGIIPDPFAFWHSSQRVYPGLNLSNYKNTKVDKLLEKARQEKDPQKRKNIYQDIQELLLGDLPAIFLYNPDYIYLVSEKIKGVKGGIIADPSERFTDIENWYIKTKKLWK
jgi:ABC-type transport system substrate-binding protein